MLDHVILSVGDLDRSVAFYGAALAPLGITDRVHYEDGPPGHPNLKRLRLQGGAYSSGCGRVWSRAGRRMSGSSRTRQPKSMRPMPPRWWRARATTARQARGFTMIPRYYAGYVLDPDGYSVEFVFKSWQHPQP